MHTCPPTRSLVQALLVQLECQRAHLTHLTVNVPLTPPLVRAVLRCVERAERLECLNLSHTGLGDGGLHSLLSLLKAAPRGCLKKLYLQNCGITDKGAHALAEFIKSSTAKVSAQSWELHLRSYRIRRHAFANRRPAGDFITTPMMRYGAAAPPPLSGSGAAAPEEPRAAVSLQIVDLSTNLLSEEGLADLLEAARLDQGLQMLVLRENRVRPLFEPYPGTVIDLGAEARAIVLDPASSVQAIDLRGNLGAEAQGITRHVGAGVDMTRMRRGAGGDATPPKVSEALKRSKAKARLLHSTSMALSRRASMVPLDGLSPDQLRRMISSLPRARTASLTAASPPGRRGQVPRTSPGKAAADPLAAVHAQLSERFDLHDRPQTAPPSAAHAHAHFADEVGLPRAPAPGPLPAPEESESLHAAVTAARRDIGSLLTEVLSMGGEGADEAESTLSRLLATVDRLTQRVEGLERGLRKRATEGRAKGTEKKGGSRSTKRAKGSAPAAAGTSRSDSGPG